MEGTAGASVLRTSPAFLEEVAGAVEARKAGNGKRRSAERNGGACKENQGAAANGAGSGGSRTTKGSKNVLRRVAAANSSNNSNRPAIHPGAYDKASRALGALEQIVPWEKLEQAEQAETRVAIETANKYVDALGTEVERFAKSAKQLSATRSNNEREKERLDEVLAAKMRRALPPWKPNEARESCAGCGAGFSFLNRRHHCRRCGDLYDAACAGRKSALPELGYAHAVRVCDGCNKAVELERKQAEAARRAQERARKDREEATRRRPMSALSMAIARGASERSAGQDGPQLPAAPFAAALRNKLLEQVKSGPALASRGSGERTCAEPPVAQPAKPRTVLDELRSSLQKRNSCPQMLKSKTEHVDRSVEQTITERRRRLEEQRFQTLLPRQGTAIAGFLERLNSASSMPAAQSSPSKGGRVARRAEDDELSEISLDRSWDAGCD